MNGTIVAQVRRVVFSPDGRALVHVVTEAGLESRLEVPGDEVQGIAPGGDYTLTLTWMIAPVAAAKVAPEVATPAQPLNVGTSPPLTQTPLPSAVDEAFMRLMARPRGRVQAIAGVTTPSGAEPANNAAEQLAQRLGLRPPRPAG